MGERIEKLFIDILKEELNSAESLSEDVRSQINAETLAQLYTISRSQDLSHIVADALEKSELLDDSEISKKFEKQKMLSVYRYMQMDYDLTQLYDVFESAKIPYIPLKGSVIRNYYPQPEMRTSCDIDILVSQNELERAINTLVFEAEYKQVKKTLHDVSLYSPSNTHLELHHTLSETDEEDDFLSNKAWEHVSAEESAEYRYKMDNEIFLAYLTVHTAKHFEAGGCGVRPFMDYYVLRKHITFDDKKAKEILSVYGLETFFDQCMYLTDVWFGEREHTELTKNMEDFILNAGVYGSQENRIAIMRKDDSKVKYILKRIFLPYKDLCAPYKKLRKYPILYPYYTVVRWFRIIFKSRKTAISEFKNSANVSDEKATHMQNMLDELGLT